MPSHIATIATNTTSSSAESARHASHHHHARRSPAPSFAAFSAAFSADADNETYHPMWTPSAAAVSPQQLHQHQRRSFDAEDGTLFRGPAAGPSVDTAPRFSTFRQSPVAMALTGRSPNIMHHQAHGAVAAASSDCGTGSMGSVGAMRSCGGIGSAIGGLAALGSSSSFGNASFTLRSAHQQHQHLPAATHHRGPHIRTDNAENASCSTSSPSASASSNSSSACEMTSSGVVARPRVGADVTAPDALLAPFAPTSRAATLAQRHEYVLEMEE